MKNEFVPYDIALAMKELGFDEPCFGYFKYEDEFYLEGSYKNSEHGFSIARPLYQQAFRWFREKHNLRGFIGFRPNVKKFDYHIYDMSLSGMEYVKQRTMEEFNKDPKVGTYEEAELGCLRKIIEIVNQNKDEYKD